MGDKIFSAEQLTAIETRDRTLLVSAAAGSGKTTTLTERIIRSLLDKKNPESIENMLIVTFTNAAVGDMREKIGKALREAVRENPDNKRLEKELFMLPSAKICTIDSFCNEILRQNAEKVGVTPGYRIAESAETMLLSTSILDSLINSIYEGELPEVASPTEFEELCDSLTDSKQTGKLAEIFRQLYGKCTSCPEGVSLFNILAEIYKKEEKLPPEETYYGKKIMLLLSQALIHFEKTLDGILNEFSGYVESERETFESDKAYFRYINSSMTYATARERLMSIKYAPAKAIKEKSDEVIFARNERQNIKDSIAKITKKYFTYTEDEWHDLYKNLYRVLSVLARFLEKFDSVYTEEKIKRGILEYSDIERFAFDCLYDEHGEKTDIAKAYSQTFTSVYIDEYQDVNELQNRIFAAVSGERNRFMVGDIKQSIYRFRSAKPEIFCEMKLSFPPLADCGSSNCASINMSQNYRCDKAIVDFVNAVFDNAFSNSNDSIAYLPSDRLKYAKVYEEGKEPPEIPAEIIIFPKKKRASSAYSAEEDEEEDELEDDIPVSEAEWTAAKIKELLECGTLSSGEKVKPSDIAILLRKKSAIESFTNALHAQGIPSETKDRKDFFLNAEVLLALCLLGTIDNPQKDIYLAGLMCSPLYGFSPDDLVRIRKAGAGGRLYSDVISYAEAHPEEEKTKRFLSELERYRILSEGMSIDSLIARLYRETGLLALASKNGGKENLMLLYNYARKFEGTSYEGLHSFISYINSIISEKAEFDSGKSDTGDLDAVKIVTIHSSKGLEYPIVFLAGCGNKFTNLDKRNRFAYSEDFGLSVYLRAPMGFALSRNPVQHIIHANMDEKYIQEELRVLYVALTRARERLFILGSAPSNDVDSYRMKMEFYHSILSWQLMMNSNSFLDVILSSIPKGAAKITVFEKNEEDGEEESTKEDVSSEKGCDACDKNDKIYNTVKKRFEYEYPFLAHTTIPEKMSVSKLYPGVLDGLDDAPDAPGISSADMQTEDDTDIRTILPSFYTGTTNDESARRGIATHTVLQFCDFDNLANNGTEAELSRLLSLGFISEESLNRVRKNEIEKFRHSELLSIMRAAKNLYREFRFNSRLPAERFTDEEDKKAALIGTKILVQGVIDCIIEHNDGSITLVDYKTDRLSQEELADPKLAYKKLYEKHSLQLEYYYAATESIFGKPPKSVGVYSLPLGNFLEFKKS